jgi:hypothetical protein
VARRTSSNRGLARGVTKPSDLWSLGFPNFKHGQFIQDCDTGYMDLVPTVWTLGTRVRMDGRVPPIERNYPVVHLVDRKLVHLGETDWKGITYSAQV